MRTLIESRTITGCYDFNFDQLIVDTDYGRVLLSEAWGGDDVNGYQYRWAYGYVFKLHDDDTFDILDEPWNDITTTIDAVINGRDDTRPSLEWPVKLIDKIARELTV